MTIKKPPFIEDIVPANRANKVLTENFLTGLPSWASKNDISGTNSANYKNPSSASGNRLELETSGSSGDEVEYISNFTIRPGYWERIMLEFKDFKIDPNAGEEVFFGLSNSALDRYILFYFYANTTSDSGNLKLILANSTSSEEAIWWTGYKDLSSPVDFSMDIDPVAETIEAGIENSMLDINATYMPTTENLNLTLLRLRAKEATVKQASISKFKLRMWQQQ